MKLAAPVALLTGALGQNVGTQKTERHPALSVQECTVAGGCVTKQKSVVIDGNWRWTHTNEGTTNCFSGNEWDRTLCPDAATCAANCALEGADDEYESTYGVHASGSDLTLKFVTEGPYSTNIGSRVYLLETEDKYKMFKLKNKEFTFDVDTSNLPCGLNGALYFVSMDEDGGMARHPGNKAGAKYGTGYCDAQCPHDIKFINGEPNVENWVPSETDANSGKGRYGSCCTEFDVWEANSISTAWTAHSCNVTTQTRCDGVTCGDNDGGHRFDGVCDKNGCDFQPFRLGEENFYGRGSSFQIDTTKPMTVVTQFVTDDGTDNGRLSEVRRYWKQGGKVIHAPPVMVGGKGPFDSLSQEFCAAERDMMNDGTNFLDKGGFPATDLAFEQGMVLALSLWDDHEANMLWLDSTYPTDTPEAPGARRGVCDITSGDPKDVEAQHPDASVKYYNIKYGEIGSTDAGSAEQFGCDECASRGFEEDQCGCGFCGSYGGCGWTCGNDASQPPRGPQCTRQIQCSECEAHGYGADQCGCGYCGSFGGCGFTCGHDANQAPLGPKCTVASPIEV
jgi:cellulose 1,4-beta-cellobiosidase